MNHATHKELKSFLKEALLAVILKVAFKSLSGTISTVSVISGPNTFSRYFHEFEWFCAYHYNINLGLRFLNLGICKVANINTFLLSFFMNQETLTRI